MAKYPIETIRHTLAHVMAYAVKQLYPDVKFGIGPVIENGFYYDFDLPHTLSSEDFAEIEKKMRTIINKKLPVEHTHIPVEDAIAQAKAEGQTYKLEILGEIKSGARAAITEADAEQQKDGKISFYTIGEFTDLCKGPHVENTGDLPADGFSITHVAGAYWRGSEKNPQMQRLYAVAFGSKEELKKHREFLEEVKKRDHRVIAQQLDLFSQHDVSPGTIFWHPKGMVIWKELEKFIREKNDQYGYGEVQTPVMVKKELYETSGHWEHYREDGFWFDVDKETYVLKPMNCPEATVIYSNSLRSYRDLPIRLSEPTGRLHRNELKGALGGLFRVRQFTQDDAHLFCRPDQIEEEVSTLLQYTKELYEIFGLPTSFRFATKPDKAMGEAALWEKAEAALEGVLKHLNIAYELKPKDGAFYGPKIDIHCKDAIGREHQVATIQLDFQMPERFKLEYHDADGTIKRPVMIHRAIYGSFERFIGVLIEHYAGAFPLWLSPVQAAVITISDNHHQWGEAVLHKLKHAGIRAELHDQNETLGKKIRNAEMQKIPYLLVIGDKEVEAQAVAARKRGQGDMGSMPIDTLVAQLKEEIELKK